MNFFQNIFVAIAFACLTFSGCSNPDESDNNNGPKTFLITGFVIDQVTKKPVGGATVYFGHTFCEPTVNPYVYSQAICDSKGEFKINFPESALDQRNGCAVVFAKKEGYKGSKQQDVIGGSGSYYIELYHPTELHLKVTNDTVSNQIDETRIRVYRFLLQPIMYPSDYNTYCKGRKFDSTFVLNLWGNYPYTIDLGYPLNISSFNKTFKPDTITLFSVSF